MIELFIALALARQLPPPATPAPPPPPPPPVATSRRVLAEISIAQRCFDDKWKAAIAARAAAQRLVEPLTARPGTAEWLYARSSVIAFVAARMKLGACVRQLQQSRLPLDGNDQAALDYQVKAMNAGTAALAEDESMLLVTLVDRDFAGAAVR